jgi:hypothetical protein
VLNALESVGYRSDGRLLALNSYENRVYQVGIHCLCPSRRIGETRHLDAGCRAPNKRSALRRMLLQAPLSLSYKT